MKKILSIIIIAALLLPYSSFQGVYAAAILGDTPRSPEQLKIEATDTNQPPIGVDKSNSNQANCYIDISWTDTTKEAFPPFAGTTGYYNVYIQEVPKYGVSPNVFLLRDSEKDIPAGTTNWRIGNLKSGTVYNIYVRSYYKYTQNSNTVSSAESIASNVITAMTDIRIDAYPAGTNQVKIEWDDAWSTGGKRVDYNLYISQNSSFSNTQPMSITATTIEPNGPIKVNKASGKLEYTHTVPDSGSVYYAKVVPQISVEKTPSSPTIPVSSYILVNSTKVSETDLGTVWRLDWTPVVTGFDNVKPSYLIYKGNTGSSSLPQYMATVDVTSFFVTIPKVEKDSYFIITADIKKDGEDVYPIKIESDQVFVKEQDVSSTPTAPDLVDVIKNNSGDPIINYSDITQNGRLFPGKLTPNSATILWHLPLKGDGSTDSDVTYTIWKITDPNQIDSPPNSTQIETGIKMTGDNYTIYGDGVLKGYKYQLKDLTPNSTYYFKIIASKAYIENVGGVPKQVIYNSQPSIKVIITPTGGPIDQPVVPSILKIKKDTSKKEMVTSTTIMIQTKNKWYEKFNASTGKWEYVKTEKTSANDTVDYVPETGTLDGKNYRMVSYDPGVTLDIGCIPFVEGVDISTKIADRITNYPTKITIGQNDDPYENPDFNPLETPTSTERLKHNIDIKIEGLDPNTTYIVWIRAARKDVNLASGPSAPLVITTAPDLQTTLEKPIVPSFQQNIPRDTSIELNWNFKPAQNNLSYKYYIKYSSSDDLSKAKDSFTVTLEDLSTTGYYKISELNPDTLYYFWIQAEASNSQDSKKSEWSDSYPVKTLSFSPPDMPTGFGIKKGDASITKSSITVQWTQIDGLEYTLEYSNNLIYSPSTIVNAKDVSEYTIDNLRANTRYYLRLYAYDPDKKLTSVFTESITVRTLKSYDEFDTSRDSDLPLSGSFIVMDSKPVNGVFTTTITGVNADRFVEYIRGDNKFDFTLDLSSPPQGTNTYRLVISPNVFKSMGQLRETFIISSKDFRLSITPNSIGIDSKIPLNSDDKNQNVEITVASMPNENYTSINFLSIPTKVTAGSLIEGNTTPLETFNSPLVLSLPMEKDTKFISGITKGYIYNELENAWNIVDSTSKYDASTEKTNVLIPLSAPSIAAIGEKQATTFTDIAKSPSRTPIQSIAAIHPLNSVKETTFRPLDETTLTEAVGFIFDMIDYSPENDILTTAVRSGYITEAETSSFDDGITREKSLDLVAKLYTKKTGQKAEPSKNTVYMFTDLDKISSTYKSNVLFATENNLIEINDTYKLNPKALVTRGEFMEYLQRVLALVGELD